MNVPAPKNTPFAARVLDWSDERRAGDGVIVTLAPGYAFEPSLDADSACHVRGFETIGAAKAGVSKEAKPCECKRCNPAMMLVGEFYTSIDGATQYATVYDAINGKPVATLNRARVMSKDIPWRLFDTAGVEIGNGFHFARFALRLLNRIRGELQA